MTDQRPNGPASYFPAIEQKYGTPIEHWLELVRGLDTLPHSAVVNRLKAEHGLGHGHANAVVAFVRAAPRP